MLYNFDMICYIIITNKAKTKGGASQPEGSRDRARQRSTDFIRIRNYDEVAGFISLDVDPIVATIGVYMEQE